MRVNTLRGEEPDLGVPARRVDGLPEALVLDQPVDVTATDAFRNGQVWPQSRSSMLPARLLGPVPGCACSTSARPRAVSAGSWRR